MSCIHVCLSSSSFCQEWTQDAGATAAIGKCRGSHRGKLKSVQDPNPWATEPAPARPASWLLLHVKKICSLFYFWHLWFSGESRGHSNNNQSDNNQSDSKLKGKFEIWVLWLSQVTVDWIAWIGQKKSEKQKLRNEGSLNFVQSCHFISFSPHYALSTP